MRKIDVLSQLRSKFPDIVFAQDTAAMENGWYASLDVHIKSPDGDPVHVILYMSDSDPSKCIGFSMENGTSDDSPEESPLVGMVDELGDVVKRLEGLSNYMATDEMEELSEKAQHLIRSQFHAMLTYAEILAERISIERR